MLEASNRGSSASKKQLGKQNASGQSRHAVAMPVIASTASLASGKSGQEDGNVKSSGVTGGKIRRALARFNLLPAINIRYLNIDYMKLLFYLCCLS
jgi:hypothetical protein